MLKQEFTEFSSTNSSSTASSTSSTPPNFLSAQPATSQPSLLTNLAMNTIPSPTISQTSLLTNQMKNTNTSHGHTNSQSSLLSTYQMKNTTSSSPTISQLSLLTNKLKDFHTSPTIIEPNQLTDNVKNISFSHRME